jgi:hypothetical protein
MPPEPEWTKSVCLDLAGGVPYVVALRTFSNVQYYAAAQTADGTAWSPPVTTGLTGTPNATDVITAYGTPWVVYHDGGAQTLLSGRGPAPGSSGWTNQANVADGIPKAEYVSMIRAGSHPAVMYVDSNGRKLMFGVYY